MENPFYEITRNFIDHIKEVVILLNISNKETDQNAINVLLKSSVVISIAYWERFVEDLIIDGSRFVAEGLRDPQDLPTIVKQSIACHIIPNKKDNNRKAFSDLVWSFSSEGWVNEYIDYSNFLANSLNTANPSNVKELFWKTFGIRDVFVDWKKPNPTSEENVDSFNLFIKKRHEIAHGSEMAMDGLDLQSIVSWINLEVDLVNHISDQLWEQAAKIVEKSAHVYNINSEYIFHIINYFEINGNAPVTNKVFQKISTTANSNYNKLKYQPWGLLATKSPKEIRPTDRMVRFINGEISLPQQIIVLKNQLAFPKPKTKSLRYEDLKRMFTK